MALDDQKQRTPSQLDVVKSFESLTHPIYILGSSSTTKYVELYVWKGLARKVSESGASIYFMHAIRLPLQMVDFDFMRGNILMRVKPVLDSS